MKLTKEKALNLLNEVNNEESKGWIAHCIAVGDTACTLAQALKEKGFNVDPEKALAMGYVHDIGKIYDDDNHTINGYYYLKEKDIDEDYAAVCLTHSYLNNDLNCTAGGIQEDIPFRTEYVKNYKYTMYDKIINLCDLMCTQEVMSIEDRMNDIIKRKGVHENTEYHLNELLKLKDYFDHLLGYNLYDLFPSINKKLK